MGIQGLLPQLKSIQQPVTLHRYSGQTLAIDGYAWLHRAAHSCAMELALGKPTSKYLQFFIKRLVMLRESFNVEPYLVFDGDSINVKKETELKRRQKRIENREKGLELWKSGDMRGSYDLFQKCVDITPEMAKCVIEYCESQNIKYLVAPYEADAQLVYLEKAGIVHGIISEDSDLLIFGCRKLITKLNDHGECIEICSDDFIQLPSRFPLSQLSSEEIRTMVCLSGCDYTSGIPQVGLLTAMKLVRKFKTMDRIIQSIQRDGKFKVPKDFIEEYELANFAFQFQRVFCPERLKLATLNEIPSELSKNEKLFKCIGQAISMEDSVKKVIIDDDKINHDLHRKISIGELNPYNFQKPLINRERKLSLVSKSEPILRKPVPVSGGIDSFFTKKSIKSVSAHVSTSVKAPQTDKITRKLETTIQRRKLCRDQSVQSGGISRFFGEAHSNSTNSINSLSPDADAELQTQPDVIAERVNLHSVSEVVSLQEEPLLHPLSAETASSDIEEFQDDMSTELPSSMLSTEIPSSMVPTQTDQEETPFSEEESEILSEVDDPVDAKRLHHGFPNKKRCKAIANLRENFSYQRTPLKAKNTNVNTHTTTNLNLNSNTANTHGKLVVVNAGKSASMSCARPALQRTALNRSKNRVMSHDSSAAPKQAVRSLSLAEFVYKGV